MLTPTQVEKADPHLPPPLPPLAVTVPQAVKTLVMSWQEVVVRRDVPHLLLKIPRLNLSPTMTSLSIRLVSELLSCNTVLDCLLVHLQSSDTVDMFSSEVTLITSLTLLIGL